MLATETHDSAGITIVTHRRAAHDTITLSTADVRIGSAALDGAENYLFELISDIAVSDAGVVYVTDNRGARIAAFDGAGSWLRDIGTEGRGPGEYVAPIRVHLRADTIFVWDAVLRRLSRYTTSGDFVGSITIRDRQAGLPFAPVPSGYIDEVEWGQNVDPAPAGAALIRRDRDGAVMDSVVGPYAVPEVGWEWTDEDQRAGMMVNPPALSVRPSWAVHDGDVLWAEPTRNEIQVHDLATGQLTRLIRLGAPGSPPTASDREAYVDAAIARFGIAPERRTELLESTTFADDRPALATIVVDDEGRIWVADHDPRQMHRRHIGSIWDVLSRDGTRLMTVQFPESFELKAVREGRAYGITRDADGVEVVEMFKVEARRTSGVDTIASGPGNQPDRSPAPGLLIDA